MDRVRLHCVVHIKARIRELRSSFSFDSRGPRVRGDRRRFLEDVPLLFAEARVHSCHSECSRMGNSSSAEKRKDKASMAKKKNSNTIWCSKHDTRTADTIRPKR